MWHSERAKQRQTRPKKKLWNFSFLPPVLRKEKLHSFFFWRIMFHSWPKGQQQKPEICLFALNVSLFIAPELGHKMLSFSRAPLKLDAGKTLRPFLVSISWWKFNRWGQTESNTSPVRCAVLCVYILRGWVRRRLLLSFRVFFFVYTAWDIF